VFFRGAEGKRFITRASQKPEGRRFKGAQNRMCATLVPGEVEGNKSVYVSLF